MKKDETEIEWKDRIVVATKIPARDFLIMVLKELDQASGVLWRSGDRPGVWSPEMPEKVDPDSVEFYLGSTLDPRGNPFNLLVMVAVRKNGFDHLPAREFSELKFSEFMDWIAPLYPLNRRPKPRRKTSEYYAGRTLQCSAQNPTDQDFYITGSDADLLIGLYNVLIMTGGRAPSTEELAGFFGMKSGRTYLRDRLSKLNRNGFVYREETRGETPRRGVICRQWRITARGSEVVDQVSQNRDRTRAFQNVTLRKG